MFLSFLPVSFLTCTLEWLRYRYRYTVLAPEPELRVAALQGSHKLGCLCAILVAYSCPVPRGTPGLSRNEALSSVRTVQSGDISFVA